MAKMSILWSLIVILLYEWFYWFHFSFQFPLYYMSLLYVSIFTFSKWQFYGLKEKQDNSIISTVSKKKMVSSPLWAITPNLPADITENFLSFLCFFPSQFPEFYYILLVSCLSRKTHLFFSLGTRNWMTWLCFTTGPSYLLLRLLTAGSGLTFLDHPSPSPKKTWGQVCLCFINLLWLYQDE